MDFKRGLFVYICIILTFIWTILKKKKKCSSLQIASVNIKRKRLVPPIKVSVQMCVQTTVM